MNQLPESSTQDEDALDFSAHTLNSLQEYYKQATDFLLSNLKLVQSHVVDYHTQHHISLIPQEWCDTLNTWNDEQLFKLPTLDPKAATLPPSLQEFIAKAQTLSYPHSATGNWETVNMQKRELDRQLVEGMKPKKIYEIKRMIDLVHTIADKQHTKNIIDIL